MARAVDSQQSLQLKALHACVVIMAAYSRLHPLQQVHLAPENDGMRNLSFTLEDNHCVACVTASNSMVRLEVVSL